MGKVKLGLGHCHPAQSHSLLLKGWWKNKSTSWNCLKWGWRKGAEARPGSQWSPSERILKHLSFMPPVLKAGSSALSVSLGRPLTASPSCYLSQEWALSGRVHFENVSDTLKGPQWHPPGQEAAHTFEAWNSSWEWAHYSSEWRFSEINPSWARAHGFSHLHHLRSVTTTIISRLDWCRSFMRPVSALPPTHQPPHKGWPVHTEARGMHLQQKANYVSPLRRNLQRLPSSPE